MISKKPLLLAGSAAALVLLAAIWLLTRPAPAPQSVAVAPQPVSTFGAPQLEPTSVAKAETSAPTPAPPRKESEPLRLSKADDDWASDPLAARKPAVQLQPVDPEPNVPLPEAARDVGPPDAAKIAKVEPADNRAAVDVPPKQPDLDPIKPPTVPKRPPDAVEPPAKPKPVEKPAKRPDPDLARFELAPMPLKVTANPDALPRFAERREPDQLPAAFYKRHPESPEDLKAIQDHLAKVVERVRPSVVCLRFGNSQGSGVIVTKEGHIMTAGHVSGAPNRNVNIVFEDGKTVKGTTLGGNHGIDSGMAKIVTPGEWPAIEIADSSQLKVGQWCFVCSHPGGFKAGRLPPVRLGRILRVTSTTIWTDCILVGGDSGGPVFDMHGRVIAINSRIGRSVENNMHVPSNPFVQSWDRLAKGEVFGGRLGDGFGKQAPASGPFLGVSVVPGGAECVIETVGAGSPAEAAGLKAEDVVLTFGGKKVASGDELVAMVKSKQPGDRVVIEIRRGEETMALTVQIGKR